MRIFNKTRNAIQKRAAAFVRQPSDRSTSVTRDEIKRRLVAMDCLKAVETCESDVDIVVVTQAAFGTSLREALALGLVAQYAGLNGKEFTIIPHPGNSSAVRP